MEDNDDTDEILDESSDENDLDYGHQHLLILFVTNIGPLTGKWKKPEAPVKKRAKTAVAALSSKNGRKKLLLHLLPTMPLDILYEVCSDLIIMTSSMINVVLDFQPSFAKRYSQLVAYFKGPS